MTAGLITLCIASFLAGFTDAIIGGGGLIQTPATLISLSKYPLATILGTTKIPSILGTSIATVQYTRKVRIRWKMILLMCCLALTAAFTGSLLVSKANPVYIKPAIFCILIIVAIYTFSNKKLGIRENKGRWEHFNPVIASVFAVIIGFYDGFIGPGAGSFMAIFFILYLGFDFLNASAHAKLLNISTNLGSIIYFGKNGMILFHYALPMAICNLAGGILGARLALLKGNTFIRLFFLIVIIATICRFGYDIFYSR